ncbi:MAG TPA: UDP-N-acetylglucosamine pyrophosphorylase [Clostridiales bacterium]|uniref:UDP-N-acetylglucosamine pyrophosphorylase n=1 Tax=Candidatus Egerieisoma faecipullorum TaxID=2840963 RepID=A0A9D1LAC0_9CLOT|nr:UDP-N-acetylglucosamine pyrophosphorylase [Clostridiales bacterium]HIU29078.1 UDP-N-acetylglucosamine pyrophosphorylase [Candidatus Egerieisoma faecipullorum]
MNNCSVNNLLDLGKTIAKELFDEVTFPWEVLPNIKEFIVRLGPSLSRDRFDNPQENVWIAKTANIFDTAYIAGPCIIDEGAEVRHCAFIRGSVIVGKNAVVGNSTELKNCLLFDGVQVPHYNYVGDSVLGYKAHLGAGAITSNVKSDKTPVAVKHSDTNTVLNTELRKFGAVVGDYTEVGCNTVLCPGTIIGRECIIYPQSRVRGVVNAGSIYKDAEHIIKRQ